MHCADDVDECREIATIMLLVALLAKSLHP